MLYSSVSYQWVGINISDCDKALLQVLVLTLLKFRGYDSSNERCDM